MFAAWWLCRLVSRVHNPVGSSLLILMLLTSKLFVCNDPGRHRQGHACRRLNKSRGMRFFSKTRGSASRLCAGMDPSCRGSKASRGCTSSDADRQCLACVYQQQPGVEQLSCGHVKCAMTIRHRPTNGPLKPSSVLGRLLWERENNELQSHGDWQLLYTVTSCNVVS